MNKFLSVAISPLREPLTYLAPPELEQTIEVGFQVEVPLGQRKATGFVVETHSSAALVPSSVSAAELKLVASSKENRPCFSASQLKFFKWIAEYHGESLSRVLENAIPAMVAPKFERSIFLEPACAEAIRGEKQKELLEFVRAQGGAVKEPELRRRFKGAAQMLRSLEKKQALRSEKREVLEQSNTGNGAAQWAKTEVQLNDVQNDALRAITQCVSRREFQSYLLYGVTGSGKTEVYIEAARHALQNGLGVLVMVPEIALTPQLIARFCARLGQNIALLHSALSARTRWDAWRALLEGRSGIALGARSALFAPLKNLGLIIVDEEHDSSYKQSDGLRYHARDLALVRGKLDNCTVVLGSATPSLETFLNVKNKRTLFLPLPIRHSAAAPSNIEVVDLNAVKPWEMCSHNISPQLMQALSEVLAEKNQAFILYNRRGFASFMQCDTCTEAYGCPNCSVTFTYHQHAHALVCHYCSLRMVTPEFCPACVAKVSGQANGGAENVAAPGKLVQRGAGTEKVFDELRELFPAARIDRLDSDAVPNFAAYREILDRVRSGKTDILVGTQMIAKGHDLPGVTLVGVVDCDVGLHMPDFRAGERVFQLLTQAAGRAGRAALQGKVILQTRVPQHRSLLRTATRDYLTFAEEELRSRERLNYPPFTRLLRIICSSTDKELAASILLELRRQAESFCLSKNYAFSFLGPAPAPLQKLKTQWRCHLLVKDKSPAALSQLAGYLRSLRIKTRKVRIAYDLDPQEML